MISFALCIPTDIRFGKGQIAALAGLVAPDARVMLLYGGGSILKNGVEAQVRAALAGRRIVAFGGVEPNPVYETLQRASAEGRAAGVDLVLGVGGGSVIDAAKFLAAMIASGEDDPWDRFVAGDFPDDTLPVGAVLTLAATGSESNAVSVISSVERDLKLPFRNERARPRFAVLDPSTLASLSRRQLENGVVDAFTHVLEQYMTWPVNAPIQYGYGETLMQVLAEWGPRLLSDGPGPEGNEARENVMWAANQALNGLIAAGVPEDWSTHMIGHAITAVYGIDHARTLTAVMPALMRHEIGRKQAMLARLGRRVWGIEGEDEAQVAARAIDATEDFFRRMGCPVHPAEFGVDFDPESVVGHLERAGHVALGEHEGIGPDAVRAILRAA
ncbi:MAG: iron-containing alcohol dehydrogenase [Pseudochelatococcus sp.]|jgi:NADP-dependent alcohol dehydrogenase|uniref:iron-containing alcohol dehydrogenase n=1 Tax=Pseudochelatococcus sp. TaxID=2020869 RepID=UPI003D921C97